MDNPRQMSSAPPSPPSPPPSTPGQASQRAPIVEWLLQVNNQISGWAASASWWRLLFLFLVVLIASSILGELLGLQHEKVRVPQPPGMARTPEEVTVTIGGRDVIRVEPKAPSVR